jgi:hypothetical protein
MKKAAELDPHALRPNLDFGKGMRGKYYARLQQGTNLVIQDPPLMPYLPDSASVNRALHAFLAIPEHVAATRPRTRHRAANPSSSEFEPRVGTQAYRGRDLTIRRIWQRALPWNRLTFEVVDVITQSQVPTMLAVVDPDLLDDPINEQLLDEEDGTEEDLRYEIASYGADYDVDGLVRRLQKGDVKVPEFQRGYVWPIKQASRFIESLLLGLPVPGIFLSTEFSTNKLLVIDGQQRLATLRSFYDGIFPLTKREFSLVDVQSSFEGKTYKTLSEDDRRTLDNAIIHATVIKQTNPKDGGSSIYKIFERLNSSGMLLSPQEIRTAIYAGPLAEVSATLRNLGTSLCFERAGLQSRRKSNQCNAALAAEGMLRTCAEFPLRFFALFIDGKSYRKPMKSFLNEFMDTHRNLPVQERESLSRIFQRCTDTISELLGLKAFKPSGSFNAALFDSIMVGLAYRLQAGPITDGPALQESIERLLSDKDFLQWISSSTADDEVVRGRISRATERLSLVP